MALLVLLSACSPIQPASLAPMPPFEPTTATAAVLSSPSPASPETHPNPTATIDKLSLPRPHYTLSAVLDYPSGNVTVTEQIAYTNRSTDALEELLLIADAQIYGSIFELSSLDSSIGPNVSSTSWDKTWLQVRLDQALQPGETIVLDAAYVLRLPARIADTSLRPMVFGGSDKQTNLVDWYFYLPPYQDGAGWLAHRPGYYGEHQAYEAADFTVRMQVSGAPSSLITAAPAPGQSEGDWVRYEMSAARTFALSLSPDFRQQSQSVGEVTVTSYYWAYHETAGKAALDTAAKAVELFTRLYGPYPYSSLAVVEADFLDGMEYDGLFFLSNGFYNLYDGQAGSYLVALAAHETAHQWWFGAVANDQALEPWLDEALCTYNEKVYLENYAPEAVEWWQQVRVMYYQPDGPVNDTIYNPRQELQPYRAYRDAVYLNGALFLDDLRALTGDEVFFAFLKDYSERFRGKIASQEDFFNTLAQYSSTDISALKGQYFAESGSN